MTTRDTLKSAARAAECLFSAELALETAIGESANLISALRTVRLEGAFSVFHGQEALEKTSELVALLSQARRVAGEVHRRLEQTAKQAGIPITNFGVTEKPQHPSFFREPATPQNV